MASRGVIYSLILAIFLVGGYLMIDEVQKQSYFSSPEEAIPLISQMLINEEFKSLANYYDLSQSEIKQVELESGEFFIRKTRPEIAHPAGFWRYKHPFAPGFEYNNISAGPGQDIYLIRVKISIDQGTGSPKQVGYDSFHMIKSTRGWQILPDQVKTEVVPEVPAVMLEPVVMQSIPSPAWLDKKSTASEENDRRKTAETTTAAVKNIAGFLHDAIKAGDAEMVKWLIDDGADLNALFDEKLLKYRVDTGFTPLQLTILASNPRHSRVKMILSGPGLERGRKAVGMEIINLLIEGGADIHAESKTGLTALHLAAFSGDVEIAQLMLSREANIHSRSHYGETPLHLAGSRAVAKLLIDNGASVLAGGYQGMQYPTPIHEARNRQIAQLLIDHGAGVNDTTGLNGNTALADAMMARRVDVVKLLLENGASPNLANHSQMTPLHDAASYPDAKILSLLLEHGANVELRNYQAKTPLELAVEAGYEENIAVLENARH